MTKRDQRLGDVSAIAMRGEPRIVESEDGGPLRLIINGRHIKPTGRYPSFKADGLSLPYEADHEEALLEISDVDKAMTSVMSQPHRVVIPVRWQNRPLVYFPDLRRIWADGTVEIVETKHDDDRRMRDPDYLYKLDAVRDVYRKKGWIFTLLGRKEIMGGLVYKNAHDIVRWAYAKVPSSRRFALEAAIDSAGGSLSYGKAAEIAGGTAMLHALVVRRAVHFDFSLAIHDDAAVMRVDHDALRRHSPPVL